MGEREREKYSEIFENDIWRENSEEAKHGRFTNTFGRENNKNKTKHYLMKIYLKKE